MAQMSFRYVAFKLSQTEVGIPVRVALSPVEIHSLFGLKNRGQRLGQQQSLESG